MTAGTTLAARYWVYRTVSIGGFQFHRLEKVTESFDDALVACQQLGTGAFIQQVEAYDAIFSKG